MELPLQGLKVLDLSTVIFGPLASQILGDYGAEVIKIEAPEGDSTRRTGPTCTPDRAALFLGVNRNKRSVVLDLKLPQARRALHKLLEGADVFMHSMRPQKLAALGIDPDTLQARYPRLVYAGLHGFGLGGPYAGRPAYDDIMQGMSGLADLMQRQTGEMQYLPTIAADKICGVTAAHAILAALFARERTGRGSFVEIPMFETMVGFTMVEHLYGKSFDPPQAEPGYPRVLAPWRRPYKTLDGYICMMPYTDAHWRLFFAEVGVPDLALDNRFKGISARTRHIAELLELAGRFIARRTTADWVSTSERLEIPAAPVARLEDLMEDEHLASLGFFERFDNGVEGAGSEIYPGVPVRFDGVRPPVRPAPRLGEHTWEVLRCAGLTDSEISKLGNNS